MAEVCITVKEYTRSDGVKVAEHERCYNTDPLPADLENLKQSLVDDLLSKDKPTKEDVKRMSDQLLGDQGDQPTPEVTDVTDSNLTDVEADEVSEIHNQFFEQHKEDLIELNDLKETPIVFEELTKDKIDSMTSDEIIDKYGYSQVLSAKQNGVSLEDYVREQSIIEADKYIKEKSLNQQALDGSEFWYHGFNSDRNIADFDPMLTSGEDGQLHGKGLYFTNISAWAESYGDKRVRLPILDKSKVLTSFESDFIEEHDLGISPTANLIDKFDLFNTREHQQEFLEKLNKSGIHGYMSYSENDGVSYFIAVNKDALSEGVIIDDFDNEIPELNLQPSLAPTQVFKSNLDTGEIQEFAAKINSKVILNEPSVTNDLKGISEKFDGANLDKLEYAVKGLSSLERKIDKEAFEIGPAATTQDVLIENVNDALRYTFIVDEDNYSKDVSGIIKELESNGYTKYKIKNAWTDNRAYKGVNTNFVKDGLVMEVQFHTKQSSSTIEPSHKLYEEFRDLGTTPARKVELDRKMSQLWGNVNNPKGIDTIANFTNSSAKPDRYNDVYQPIWDNVEDSDKFQEWSKGRELLYHSDIGEIRTGEPAVLAVHHGTTHDFYSFEGGEGSPEGFLGATNYFTSDPYDAEQNYGSLEGPDLKGRIERLAEDIEYDINENYEFSEDNDRKLTSDELTRLKEDYGIDDDEYERRFPDNGDLSYDAEDYATIIAEKRLYGENDQIMDLAVRVDNPIVINGDGSDTWVENIPENTQEELDEAWEDIKFENDYEDSQREEYEDEITERVWESKMYDEPLVAEALRRAWWDADVVGDLDLSSFELYDSDVSLNSLRENIFESFPHDDDGRLVSGDVFNRTLINLGHDAVILKNAERQFAGMNMSYRTSHIHIPDQYRTNIKLIDGRNIDFKESASIIDRTQVKSKLSSVTTGTRFAGLTLREILSTPEGRAFWRENGIDLLPD